MTGRALALALLLAVPGAAQDKARFQDVRVKPGDTLWGIANTYLKDPTRWNEILKHNRLPTADPTVALPGLTLKVPVALIKDSMLAASLVTMVNDVLARKRETPEWKAASQRMQLFKDDGLRTLAASRARVQFVTGEALNLDENSMAILKPRGVDADLQLLRGEIHAGRSRVVTPSARITPKSSDTRFTAKVREDLSTLVQVYAGRAAVEGQGKVLDVRAGYSTEVAADQAPTEPVQMPDTAEFRARALGQDVFSPELLAPARAAAAGAGAAEVVPSWRTAGGAGVRDIEQIGFDLKALQIGVPVAAYAVQVSRQREFERLVIDKTFDAEERIDLSRALPPGRYWIRVAIVDLLGARGRFSDPRQYAVTDHGAAELEDEDRFSGNFQITLPPDGDDVVRIPKYRVSGRADKGITVSINGRQMRLDASGYYFMDVLLKEGINRFDFLAQDGKGRTKTATRRVTYEP